jgi:hypothetical protein
MMQVSRWYEALEDAKRKHAEGRKYVAHMRVVIRIIERKIASGEPFPGDHSGSWPPIGKGKQ